MKQYTTEELKKLDDELKELAFDKLYDDYNNASSTDEQIIVLETIKALNTVRSYLATSRYKLPQW